MQDLVETEPRMDEGTEPEKIRVLVVDNDPGMRNLIHLGLVSLGFSATSAANGMEAARLALEKAFEVVVSDFQLPDFSGAELSRRLMATPGSPRVILIGAHADAGEIKEAYLSGAALFLPSPFCMRELAQVVHLVAMERRYGYKGLVSARGRSREGVA